MAKSHDEPCLASAGLKRSSSLSLATEFCHKLPYSGRLVPFTARAYLSPEPCLPSAGLKRSSSLSLATEFCHKLPYSGRLVPFTARAYLSPEPCDRSLRAASLPVEAYGSEESRHCKRAKTVPVSPTSPRYHADKFGKENQVDSFLFRCADFIACDILGDQDCPAFSKTRHELVDMAMENMSVDSYHPHPDCLTLSYSADLQHEMKNQSVEVQIVARNMLQIALKHVHEN